MTPKKHVTSHANFYRVCEWVTTTDLTKIHSFDEAAIAATKALNFTVPHYTVKSALEATGKSSNVVRKRSSKNRDRVVVLATELAALMRELGKEPSAELLSVVHRKGAT